MRVDLRGVILLLLPQELLVFFLVLFRISIYLLLHMLEVIRNEDATALATCLRLWNEKYGWLFLSFSLRQLTWSQLTLPFSQSLRIILCNLVQVLWIEPCLWEKPVMVRELFLKTLQMDRQSILPGNVIHAKEVINALVRLKLWEELRCDSKVLPADLPIQILGVGRQEALKLLK